MTRPYVREAVMQRADLSAFREPPSFRIVLGMGLLVLSYVACWPLISVLGGLAAYLRQPWIAAAGPVVYGLSHLCFLAGIALTGVEHLQIVLRWATRKGVEKLLASQPGGASAVASAQRSKKL